MTRNRKRAVVMSTQPGRRLPNPNQLVEVFAKGRRIGSMFRLLPAEGEQLVIRKTSHLRPGMSGLVTRVEPGIRPSDDHPGAVARVFVTLDQVAADMDT